MSTSVALKRPLRKASSCCIACRSCGIDSQAVGSAPQAQGARLLLVHRRLAHQRRHRLCHKAVPSEAGGDLGAISQSTERGTGGTSAEPQQPCSSEQPSVGGVGKLVAAAAFLGGIAVVLGLGVVFKDQIQLFLAFFIRACNEWGLLGCLAYMVMYTVLELLAVPAIPLTMTAGVIFGVLPGTIMTSIAGTAAATLAFLFARYVARDKVIKLAERSPKFAAIDRVLGRNGFKVVTLLRLSPLLPLAISNYIYGLTSVRLDAYVTGSFLGMLPGTFAYVTAGFLGREVLTGEAVGAAVKVQPWQVALGLAASAAGLLYVGRLAKTALDEMEQQDAAAAAGSLGKGPPSGAGDGLVQLAVAQ